MKKLLFPFLILMLTGCVNTPKQLRGEFSDIEPRDYSENPTPGVPVRWGGLIIETTPKENETCIKILGKETDKSGRPRLRDRDTTGRFIACKPGFYDPAVYKPDRRITVAGKVTDIVGDKIGEHTYQYPKVDAETFYLWYDFDYTDRYYRPPIYGGWLWYYPYSGFYYSGPGFWWGWYDPFPLYYPYYPHRYRYDHPRRPSRLNHSNTRPPLQPRSHAISPRVHAGGGTPRLNREK